MAMDNIITTKVTYNNWIIIIIIIIIIVYNCKPRVNEYNTIL